MIFPTKRIQQELCRVICVWDDKIPDELSKYWKEWLEDLDKLNNLSICRCFKPPNHGKIETALLYHFSDVSESEYGIATVATCDLLTSVVLFMLLLYWARPELLH